LIFTPEQMADEARLIGTTARDFVAREVVPELPRLERQDWTAARQLIERCGDLGLLGIDVGAEHGGSDAGIVAAVAATERMAAAASFRTTTAVQTNLAILPLALFGTGAQRAAYLPSLLSGRRIGAFCLTEGGSGSDAFSSASVARPSPDGGFTLNGQKLWITNGGIADLFLVFANVPERGLTAFLVDRSHSGVAPGREERKMGLHGSSTTPVAFTEVPLAADQVLGQIGRGRDIALTALNYARLKLGAMTVGEAKNALADACRHAAGRRQFGQAIGHFGAVAEKLGEMAVRIYAAESIVYRTAGMLDAARRADARDGAAHPARAIDSCAVEASAVKVAGSEMLEWVLGEAIQIHGANGYSADYPAERRFRDARANRIFEGTNEINRLFLANTLIKHGSRINHAPQDAAADAPDESGDRRHHGRRDADAADLDPRDFRSASQLARQLMHTARFVVELTTTARPEGWSGDQEALLRVADLAIDAYAAQTVLLRAKAAMSAVVAAPSPRAQLHAAAATAWLHGAADRMRAASRNVAAAFLRGTELTRACAVIDGLTSFTPVNGVQLRRALARAALERGAYPLEW
jgi:alkylation response protein AidB-like acyl-CoA dehydrogenase